MFELAYWVLPLVILAYFATNAVFIERKEIDHFPVGSPLAQAPKFVLNLLFTGRAAALLKNGYKKVRHRLGIAYVLCIQPLHNNERVVPTDISPSQFENSAFRLIRNDGDIVILPLPLLEELSALPVTVANPQAALEHDLLGRYTGLNLILENRLHYSIVQRRLTPRLPLLIPRMEKAVTHAFEESFSQSEEWTKFQPYQILGGISARVAAEAIVGPEFSGDPTWLGVAVNYTENRKPACNSNM
jgi:ent-kaurene oxidase